MAVLPQRLPPASSKGYRSRGRAGQQPAQCLPVVHTQDIAVGSRASERSAEACGCHETHTEASGNHNARRRLRWPRRLGVLMPGVLLDGQEDLDPRRVPAAPPTGPSPPGRPGCQSSPHPGSAASPGWRRRSRHRRARKEIACAPVIAAITATTSTIQATQRRPTEMLCSLLTERETSIQTLSFLAHPRTRPGRFSAGVCRPVTRRGMIPLRRDARRAAGTRATGPVTPPPLLSPAPIGRGSDRQGQAGWCAIPTMNARDVSLSALGIEPGIREKAR